jgi:ACS family tartrate transporter-like MFS transporter
VAAGIAVISSIGSLGGFFGPSLLGSLSDGLGSPDAGIAVLGALMAAAGLLIAVACREYGLRPAQEVLHGD